MWTPFLIILILGTSVLGMTGVPGRSITQPIAFNHRLHIEEVGAECIDCHLYARDGARATIPNIEVCIQCHEEAVTESGEEARTVEHIQDGVPIPWKKVYHVPDHVYFSHRRHTKLGGIECQRCHGAVEVQEAPFTRPLVRLDMDACMNCHRESKVSNDCILCHR